jgi:hypothetical protein
VRLDAAQEYEIVDRLTLSSGGIAVPKIARVAVIATAVALSGAVGAHASVKVGVDARQATLRVDTGGDAQVSWLASDGTTHTVVVGRDGSLRFGGTLAGGDVSRAASGVTLPWAVVVRETPDGSLYALQSWRRLEGGPVELRFSRWRGSPTALTLRTVCCKWGSVTVQGSASFHGRAIFGYHATAQGDPLDPYGRNVYLDSYRDGRWVRMMGILTHRPRGDFSLWIRSNWVGKGYRGTISGPNWGWTLGPDALAQTAAAP